MPPGLYSVLVPLLDQLPADAWFVAGHAFAEPPEVVVLASQAVNMKELEFRRYECATLAKLTRFEAEKLEWKLWVVQRWQQALPALLARYATPDPHDPNPEAAELASWRGSWLRRRARPLPPETATRWYLLQARIVALEAEAAALAAVLPPPEAPAPA